MASIQINRGNSQEINNTPITDGLILFNTTNKTIYMDNENTRDVYSGQLSSSSDVEIVNLSDGQIIIWDETNNKWKNTDRYFDINNLTDVNLNSLANGQILKYDETSGEWINTDYTINDLSNVDINLSTLADGQIIVYNATTDKWENSEVKGGHKILNDSGTTLAQKDNLQFKGVYTQNNGDNTEVDICRTMTKAQMEALSGEALKGFINTSDEPDSLPLTAEWVAYDSNTSVKEKIDEVDSKFIKFTPLSNPSNIPTSATSYNCNWQDYNVLSFELCRYSNVRENIIVSKAYFSTTDSAARVMIASSTGMEVSIWQNGQGSITANANSQSNEWNVKVWGISLATN